MFRECAYVLRYLELNHRGNEDLPWSLRQTAFYHRFDKSSSTSSWVYVALSLRAQARLDAYLKATGNVAVFNPFELHLLLLDTAMANWRPYLVHLAAQTNNQVGDSSKFKSRFLIVYRRQTELLLLRSTRIA
jgi:hypothetical protein